MMIRVRITGPIAEVSTIVSTAVLAIAGPW
jgi:hypothetical protein